MYPYSWSKSHIPYPISYSKLFFKNNGIGRGEFFLTKINGSQFLEEGEEID